MCAVCGLPDPLSEPAELEKARHNLTVLALNIAVAFVVLGILLIAIITFYSRHKKLAEKLRQCELTGPVADQIKKVGKLEPWRAAKAQRVARSRATLLFYPQGQLSRHLRVAHEHSFVARRDVGM
jgi:hypothetical protein